MKKIGVSNTLFYYTQTGDYTYTIAYKYVFKDEVDIEKFKAAANGALKNYPEFSMRPVIQGCEIYAKQQDEPIVFIEDLNGDSIEGFAEDGGRRVDLGSDDTNGYLFCFRYGRKHISISFYHGLTDIKGIMTYLTDVMYRYFKALGGKLPEVEEKDILSRIRTAPINIEDISDGAPDEDILRMLDPYNAYIDSTDPDGWHFAGSEYERLHEKITCKDAHRDKPDEAPQPFDIFSKITKVEGLVRHYTIELGTVDFVKKTKELKVSFIPLLNEIISSSVMKCYDTGDAPVVAMVPADMRGVFGAETLVNFSDGISIPYTRDGLGNDICDNCSNFKDIMMQQMNREHFSEVLLEKSIRISSAQAESDTLPELIEGFAARSRGPKYTYVLTYPGKITFSESIDKMFEDIHFICRPNKITVLVYTFADKMRFEMLVRSEDTSFARCIYEGVKEHGFEARFTDNGVLTTDKVELARL